MPNSGVAEKQLVTSNYPQSKLPDTLTLLRLRFDRKLTYEEIAVKYDSTRQSVYEKLHKALQYLPEVEDVGYYEKNRPGLLNIVEAQLVGDLLDTDKRTKASLNNTAYAFQQIHNARRIESGLSTENISIIAKLDGIEKHIADQSIALQTLDIEINNRNTECIQDIDNASE